MRRVSTVGVMVVLALVLMACTEDTPAPADPISTVSEPVPGPVPVPARLEAGCPSKSTPVRFPDGGLLPEGAVAARVCQAESEYDGGLVAQVPAELLSVDLAGLVKLANGLAPPAATPQVCTLDGGPTYSYWFLYPDGDARAITFEDSGCRNVFRAPGQLFVGGRDLAAAFRQRLLEQRANSLPPGASAVPSCGAALGPSVMGVGDDLELATAALCRQTGNRQWRRAVLSPDQVALLNADYSRREQVGEMEYGGRSWLLVGNTVWGDPIGLPGGSTFLTPPPDDPGSLGRYVPSPEVLAMLDELATEPRLGCPPPATTVQHPDAGGLPRGAVAVRLCNGALEGKFEPPLDLLIRDADGLVDVVNALPGISTGEGCFEDRGSVHVFWFVYPGGEERAVTYDSGGCGRATLAPGVQRASGLRLLDAFVERLLVQRAGSAPSRPLGRPRCNEAVVSVLPVSGDEPFRRVVLCLDSRPGAVDLTARQLRMVNADLGAERLPFSEPAALDFLLLGQTGWGDRRRIAVRDGTATIGVSDGQPLGWRVSDSVLRLLDRLSGGRPPRSGSAM